MNPIHEFKPSLGSDNHSGIHPKILSALVEANTSHSPSYGQDPLTAECEKVLKKTFGEKSESFLVFNGTAANVVSLKALLKTYEAVICSEQAHLHLDECGAPEMHLGSKLLTLPSRDGKITCDQIEKQLVRRGDQHHVQPGVVSITLPTELGCCYSVKELKELRAYTKKQNLRLHVDGARLPNAAHFLELDLRDLCEVIEPDALSFGGTKNGLLGAECIVFWNPEYARDFKFYRKQMMQLPSKMRFLSAQFLAFLNDGLYQEIAAHSHAMAKYLALGLEDVREIELLFPIESNAVFARIPKAWTKKLKEQMFFYVWDENDWSCRLMTSFDTEKKDLDQFIHCAQQLAKAKETNS